MNYGADRSAKFTKTIKLDIEVIKATNFENLASDKIALSLLILDASISVKGCIYSKLRSSTY